jgi:AAA domain-containing protein/FaeA-like protein
VTAGTNGTVVVPPAGGTTGGTDDAALLAELRSGAWLDRQQFPPLAYHVPGILPEGATLLVGPPKVGKSWLVLSIALAVASGGRALGVDVDQRPVLLLALEDGPRRLQDRCRTLLDGMAPIPEALEYLTALEPGTVTATIRTWLDRHLDGPGPLVVLDTLGKVMPPSALGESAYQRDYRVGSALKRLTDRHPGTALVINHHDRKAETSDFVEKVSGTNGLAGAADTIVVVTRERHAADGIVAVTGRDVAEAEYAVRFDGERGLWTLQGTGLQEAARKAGELRALAGLDERSAAIVAYIAAHPTGVRAGEVAQAVGIDDAQARQYLTRLYDTDRVQRLGRGVYGPVASVASVAFDESAQLTAGADGSATTRQPVASVAFEFDEGRGEGDA